MPMITKPRSILPVVLLITALLTWTGCTEKSTSTDTTPPGTPALLPSPPDSAWNEMGTDAIPAEDWIELAWLKGSESDLRGYRIYRSTPPNEFLTLLTTKILGIGDLDTVYQDSTVEIGLRYKYQITAFDQAGNESAASDTVDYMLISKLSSENLTSPRGEIQERQPVFSWISTGQSLQNHLRVYDVLEDRTIWVSSGHDPFSSPHSVLYNDDGQASHTLLFLGREYWWRVDREGTELRSGSESNWVSFTVR
jgi:hypothetical protein